MRRPRQPNNAGNVRMTANRVALIDWDEAHVDVPDLVLPGNAAGLGDGAHDTANVVQVNDAPTTLDRVQTARGEIVLRRSGPNLEIISNGVFLMDTSDGTSERLLVQAALTRCATPSPRLLIGGLGVGFSLAEAAARQDVAAIDVVEIEPAVIGWHERHLSHITGPAMADPRVRIIEADVVKWLQETTGRYDAICLDIDNGPGWLVFDTNAAAYTSDGLGLAYRCLTPGGVLAVWSARRDLSFEERLHARFGAFEMLETEVGRGAPDVVYLSRRPRDHTEPP